MTDEDIIIDILYHAGVYTSNLIDQRVRTYKEKMSYPEILGHFVTFLRRVIKDKRLCLHSSETNEIIALEILNSHTSTSSWYGVLSPRKIPRHFVDPNCRAAVLYDMFPALCRKVKNRISRNYNPDDDMPNTYPETVPMNSPLIAIPDVLSVQEQDIIRRVLNSFRDIDISLGALRGFVPKAEELHKQTSNVFNYAQAQVIAALS